MHSETRRLKVLLSAYACEPNRGSEPGVGWRWTEGLADIVDLSVVTRTNNRDAIEANLKRLSQDHPLHRVHFIYHDLPKFFIWMKRAGILRTMPYYFLWQLTAAKVFKEDALSSDIVHHLTFCSPLCPGFWSESNAARIIGPVGAPLVNANYMSLFGIGRFFQIFRSWTILHLNWIPWLRRAFYDAAAVIPANSETKQILESMGIRCESVMLDTGAPIDNKPLDRKPKLPGYCNFLYAGVLERRKGLELALRAFAILIADADPSMADNQSFTVLGSGPDHRRLKNLARSLGISSRVHFAGSVPQSKVCHFFAKADVFVFTSLRDTSGGVNLEAMASGLPILCVAHQGVADVTDSSCAIRVSPGTVFETVDSLAKGMALLSNSPETRIRLGYNARRRAYDKFSWSEKYDQMEQLYKSVVALSRK